MERINLSNGAVIDVTERGSITQPSLGSVDAPTGLETSGNVFLALQAIQNSQKALILI